MVWTDEAACPNSGGSSGGGGVAAGGVPGGEVAGGGAASVCAASKSITSRVVVSTGWLDALKPAKRGTEIDRQRRRIEDANRPQQILPRRLRQGGFGTSIASASNLIVR